MLKIIVKVVVTCAILAVAFVGVTNAIVIFSVQDRIVSADEIASIAKQDGKFDCAEVLGAAVNGDTPSLILSQRLDASMELVQNGSTDILLFSGDNSRNEYNEVAAMKSYALENGADFGVSKDNIYLDYAGFSTYDSMYRLRDVFATKRAVIVTQKYHLYRALYVAEQLGIEAYGVEADPYDGGQFMREVREILARTKDFCYVLFDQKPKYLGDTIDLVYPANQKEPEVKAK